MVRVNDLNVCIEIPVVSINPDINGIALPSFPVLSGPFLSAGDHLPQGPAYANLGGCPA